MAKEEDPLADYFPSPEEEYSAYKKRKREKEEKERIEKEMRELRESDDQSSDDTIVQEKIAVPSSDDHEFTLSDEEMEELDRWEHDNQEDEEDAISSKDNCQWSLMDNAECLSQEQLTILLRFLNQDEEDLSISNNDAEKKRKFVEWLGNNKKVKRLLELKGRINEFEKSGDLREKIREVGIYAVDEETISLQHAVNFSRKRLVSGDKATENKIDPFSEGEIIRFLSSGYRCGDSGVFHKFNYPNDYLWIGKGWKAIYDGAGQQLDIMTGFHGNDFDEVDLKEPETWPLHDETDVDIDVEVEINFQRCLKKIESIIKEDNYKSPYWDIILRIPYSHMSKVSMFEIRLIDFLHQRNIKARVSISICKPETDIEERACLDAILLKMH